MQHRIYEHMPSENIFLRVEKKNIKIGAFVLLLIGLALLVLTIKFYSGEMLFFSLLLPIFYIITSIFGLISITFDSKISTLIYYILLIILIIINILSALFSVGFLVYLIINPFECDSTKSDTCGSLEVLYYLLIGASVVFCIISTIFTFLLLAFLKSVRNYRESKKQFEMSEF